MENLTIQVGSQAQTFTPKLTYSFYKQTRDDKELQNNGQDGFSALVEGLLEENVDMIIAFYHHALAWYKRSQPSEDAVEEALEGTIFASDEATTKAFTDIIIELKKNDFLARKLNEYIKNSDKNMDAIQEQIDQTEDKDRRQQLTIGLQQMNDEISKLKDRLKTETSSPKPEGAE